MKTLTKILKIFHNILKGLLLWFTAFITIAYICSVGWMIDTSNFLLLGIIMAELALLYFICNIFLDLDDLKKYSGYNLFNKLFHFKNDIDEEDIIENTIEDTMDKE